jgi:hypothetical protein
MRIIKLLINESVMRAKVSLNESSSDDVIERCGEYLARLEEYREQLFSLRELPEIDLRDQSTFAMEMVSQARAAVRAAIEITVSELKRTEALLMSFTSISIYEAAETLNAFRHDGSNNWEVDPSGVRFSNGSIGGWLRPDQAVEIAGQLRRDAYALLNKATASKIDEEHTERS